MTPTNWIEDENIFRLAQPPDWWLQRLFDFDHMLVVMPSRKTRTHYLLARRRQYSAGLGDVAMLDNKHPDTNMCYAHGVIPIGPLVVKKGGQNPFSETTIAALITELRRRDTWATKAGIEGGEDYADGVEAAESVAEAKQRADLKDGFYHRARDAWRSLNARVGRRNKRASDYHGAARQSKPTVKITVPTNP